MSDHRCEVVPVKFEKHPNADRLGIATIFDGYTYVGSLNDWANVEAGAYIPPDSLVDVNRPEFNFLSKDGKYDENSNLGGPYARIKAKKLRGIVSYGLMVPAKPEWKIGEDVAEQLGVKHYEPPLRYCGKTKDRFMTGGEVESAPNVFAPKYDVESFQKYAKKAFTEGEPIIALEKIHGANGRWVYHNGRYYCGSRTEWKREYAKIPIPDRNELIEKITKKESIPEQFKTVEEYADFVIQKIEYKNNNPLQNMWWKALRSTPALEEWLLNHPDIVVYGEVYGSVQNLRYGVPPGQVRIAVFDLLKGTQWIDYYEARKLTDPYNVPWVPEIPGNPIMFDFNRLIKLAEGKSLILGADNIREGIVVKPVKERSDPKYGRIQLKIVSHAYLGLDPEPEIAEDE